jgi:hypothetical protein
MARKAVRLPAAVALGVALLGIGVGRVAACRCADIDDAQAMAKADVAFKGVVKAELVHSRPSGAPATFSFVVEEPLQGPIERGQVTLSAETNPRGCGIDFLTGQRWVIFASASDATNLSTDACSGSQLIAEQATGNESTPPRGVGIPMQVIGLAALLVVLAAVSLLAFGKRPSDPPGTSR